ncbi:MAG: metal-dependent hydrolase [Promethearchaeota archaeon]
MDFFTHLLIGLILNILLLGILNFKFILFTGFMAIFPDLDVFLEVFKKVRSKPILAHKGISHSYIAGLIISIPSGLFYAYLTKDPFLFSIFSAFIFYSLHVTLDGLTASKIPLFFPFSKKRYRIFIDRAINPILFILSPSFFTISLLVLIITRNLTNFLFLFQIYSYFYMFYFGSKILIKIGVHVRLNSTQRYIPGIMPFFYYIHERTESNKHYFFKLHKNFIFSKKDETIFNLSIKRNSLEENLLNKALKISKSYPFFAKWEGLLPLMKKVDNKIIVYLFLAESYARERVYYLKVVFDASSQEIIEKKDGFELKMKNILASLK